MRKFKRFDREVGDLAPIAVADLQLQGDRGFQSARNAKQHGAESSPVDVSLEVDASEVWRAVRNGGPPIPPDALPTIFDPLVRGFSPELQKQRRPGSIGQGLYIAREIVTAHGGAIDVKSSTDAGTVFTVRLPRSRSTA